MRVGRTESTDEVVVSGRGELHLSVLIENMRREGLEFQVSKPEAITREIDGRTFEPYERITIDTPEGFVGVIAEELVFRLAKLEDMRSDENGYMRVIYSLPTRGLIGFRSFLLRATRGNAIMNSELMESQIVWGVVPKIGRESGRERG